MGFGRIKLLMVRMRRMCLSMISTITCFWANANVSIVTSGAALACWRTTPNGPSTMISSKDDGGKGYDWEVSGLLTYPWIKEIPTMTKKSEANIWKSHILHVSPFERTEWLTNRFESSSFRAHDPNSITVFVDYRQNPDIFACWSPIQLISRLRNRSNISLWIHRWLARNRWRTNEKEHRK